MGSINQKWKTVEYTPTQIKRAGKTIIDDMSSPEEKAEAIKVIDNWRAAHAYPLHVFYINLKNMVGKHDGVVVVQRLKRLDSIIGKLIRQPQMNLYRMQDLGGCRVVVPTLEEVFAIKRRLENSNIRHIFIKESDYINNPKASGYRSLHLVYKFHSDKIETYNKNMLIEIQVRTHTQHMWATALETMGIFTQQALKAGQGSEEVKRFFVVAASLFALEEKCPVVPETSNDKDVLIRELKEINKSQHILDILSAINVAMVHKEDENKNGYHVLRLDYSKRVLNIRSFPPSRLDEANEYYSNIENTMRDNVDVVLVRAQSFEKLKSAYPNYFADIGGFVSLIRKYLNTIEA